MEPNESSTEHHETRPDPHALRRHRRVDRACCHCDPPLPRCGIETRTDPNPRATRGRFGSVYQQHRSAIAIESKPTARFPSGSPRPPSALRPRPQRLDDDQRRAGALHDASRPGAVLRRPGAAKERALRAGPVPGHRRPGHHPLVGCRLQPLSLRSGNAASGRLASTPSSRASDRRPTPITPTGSRTTSSRCTR